MRKSILNFHWKNSISLKILSRKKLNFSLDRLPFLKYFYAVPHTSRKITYQAIGLTPFNFFKRIAFDRNAPYRSEAKQNQPSDSLLSVKY
jgi:hypothetical protein